MNRLDQFEALEKAATAGEWLRLHDKPPTAQADDYEERDAFGVARSKAQPAQRKCNCAQVWSHAEDVPVAYCAVGPDHAPDTTTQMANAALIAAARNLAPALINLARTAQDCVEKLGYLEERNLTDTERHVTHQLRGALAELLKEAPDANR